MVTYALELSDKKSIYEKFLNALKQVEFKFDRYFGAEAQFLFKI